MALTRDHLSALNFSEILAEYVEIELKKEAEVLRDKQINDEKASETAAEDFLAFQDSVNATPHLKQAFKEIQTLLSTNPEYAKTVDAGFVSGVMLLKIDE